ncbi:hypothetical protein MRX96_046354 [Rhipicephalus microplus]
MNTPPSTWVAQPDKGDLNPVFLEINASSFLKNLHDPPLKELSEHLPPNNQRRNRPQHAISEGHGRSARSTCSKNPKPGKQRLATYSTRSTSTDPGTCAFIQELPTAFFAVQCEKLQYVASTPATRAHPSTWLGGQGSGLEFIWLGCRGSPRSSPTVAATATAGPPGRPG